MNITITFRQLDASEAIKGYASDKCGKLQKFLRRPMSARITLSLDKLKHMAEARISSGGAHYEARAGTNDMYASIDKVMDRLERQIRGNNGAVQAKKRRGAATLRGALAKAPLQPSGPGVTRSGATSRPKKAKAASRGAKVIESV